MPEEFHHLELRKSPRGNAGRNRALDWIKQNASKAGVFYFADDDNSYDIRLFDEVRRTAN